MDAVMTLSPLATRIESALDSDLNHPWCVHRLYERLGPVVDLSARETLLETTQRAAEELVRTGRARREYVSAIAIGVHCEDSVFWSVDAKRECLAEFGPEYEAPTILNRMASHFQCHGL